MRTYTDRFHIGAGSTVGPLTVFPVWSESAPVPGFDGPRQGNIEVKELDEPTVSKLHVANPGRSALLIPEGTILDGGRQTRVVVQDTLVRAGSNRSIDVRCVEQGRWGGGNDHAVDGRAPVSVVSALRGIGLSQNEAASQDAVWQRVHRLEEHFGTRETNSLLDLMQDQGLNERPERRIVGQQSREGTNRRRVTSHLLSEVRRIAARALPGQAGVLVGMGGEPIALELHGNPDVFSRQIQAVLSAVLLDANTVEWRPTHGQKARDFAEEIMYTPVDVFRASPTSQSFQGVGENADIRSLASSRSAATLHMSVINRQHQVALAH